MPLQEACDLTAEALSTPSILQAVVERMEKTTSITWLSHHSCRPHHEIARMPAHPKRRALLAEVHPRIFVPLSLLVEVGAPIRVMLAITPIALAGS